MAKDTNKYYVTLIAPSPDATYWVNGTTFRKGIETLVDKDTHDYLESSVLFENRIEEPKKATAKRTTKKEEEVPEKEGE